MMKCSIISIIIAIVCGFSLCASLAQATLITIEITAEVDSVVDNAGYLEGQINPGDIITGSYTYESSTQDSNPSLSVGSYWHYAPPCGISLGVGGFMFSTDPANIDFVVSIGNDHPWFDPYINKDNYSLRSYNNLPLSNGTLVDHISWQLDDPTGSAISSVALPTTPPVLDDWQSIVGLRMDGERYGYIVDAHVTSAIPEPASILLFALGALFLRKRN